MDFYKTSSVTSSDMLNSVGSEQFIENEKLKIKNMNLKNIQILDHVSKFAELLDKIEFSLNIKTQIQLDSINDLQSKLNENSELLQKIRKNFIR